MTPDAHWKQVARKAAPFAWIPISLWLLQVWSIYDSDFTMEVTLLQLPFVMVFEIVIVLIANDRVKAQKESSHA